MARTTWSMLDLISTMGSDLVSGRISFFGCVAQRTGRGAGHGS